MTIGRTPTRWLLALLLCTLPAWQEADLAADPAAATDLAADPGADPGADPAPAESLYYTVHTVPIPDDIVLEVGGLLPLPDDALLVSTRRGELWHIAKAGSEAPVFTLFADGLQEPLGLLEHEGWILTAQRGELTRLRDVDGDLRADEFEVVCDDWDISGSYHEYAFGPRVDPDGNLWVTLNIPFGGEPFGKVDWRGWAMRITPDGEMQPVAAGLRSPAGVETSPWGDVFYTDNQGEWNGASKLCLLTEGSFFGHPMGIDSAHRPESRVDHPGAIPDGILMPTAAKRVPGFTLPAVWFPYDVTGRSPSGMVWDTSEGAFGPFAGQLFVGDQYGANMLRVFLEEVDGVWQGACFRFREGLQSGVIRVAQARDSAAGLWVGMSDRGWSSLGPDPWGLQRIDWTGETPFEIASIEAFEVGFRMTFTAPLDESTVRDPDSWALRRFTYRLHSDYGSPELDDWAIDLVEYSISADGRQLELLIDDLREGYVHEIIAEGLRDTAGRPLLHPEAWYTLIERPGEDPPPRVVLVAAEDQDGSEATLAVLASLLERDGLQTELVTPAAEQEDGDDVSLPGLAGLRDADVVVLALGNQRLDDASLDLLMRYVDSGRPLLALRASLAPFDYDPEIEDQAERFERTQTFVEDVLGVADLEPATIDSSTTVTLAPPPLTEADPGSDAALPPGPGALADIEQDGEPVWHPALRGVGSFPASSGLGHSGDLDMALTDDCRALLLGRNQSGARAPVLWVRTRNGARQLVTTLGHPNDFRHPEVRRLLLNGIRWALDDEDAIPAEGSDPNLPD